MTVADQPRDFLPVITFYFLKIATLRYSPDKGSCTLIPCQLIRSQFHFFISCNYEGLANFFYRQYALSASGHKHGEKLGCEKL